MARTKTATEFVAEVRDELLRCGYSVLFVTFECTCWGGGQGLAIWKFRVQLAGQQTLTLIEDSDPETVLAHAKDWLGNMTKEKAA